MLKFFLKHSNRKPPFLQFPCIYIIAQNNADVCAIFWQFVLFIVILWNTVRKLSLFLCFHYKVNAFISGVPAGHNYYFPLQFVHLKRTSVSYFSFCLKRAPLTPDLSFSLTFWHFWWQKSRFVFLPFIKADKKHYYFINIISICENTLFLTKILPYAIFYAKILYYLIRVQRQIPHFLSF